MRELLFILFMFLATAAFMVIARLVAILDTTYHFLPVG